MTSFVFALSCHVCPRSFKFPLMVFQSMPRSALTHTYCYIWFGLLLMWLTTGAQYTRWNIIVHISYNPICFPGQDSFQLATKKNPDDVQPPVISTPSVELEEDTCLATSFECRDCGEPFTVEVHVQCSQWNDTNSLCTLRAANVSFTAN